MDLGGASLHSCDLIKANLPSPWDNLLVPTTCCQVFWVKLFIKQGAHLTVAPLTQRSVRQPFLDRMTP